MAEGDVETFYEDGHWWNRVAGQTDKLGPRESREQALERGSELAGELRVDHIVRDPGADR